MAPRLLSFSASIGAAQEVPSPQGFVTDRAGVIDTATGARLTALIEDLEQRGLSDDVSVAILEGLSEGETVITGPYRTVKTLKHKDAVKKKEGEEKKDDGESESGVQVEVD